MRGFILPLLGMARPAAELDEQSTSISRSPQSAPVIIELFTSEGCSSCPPADKWLATLKGRSDVIALSFHVDYWDYLGWPDPFASKANTDRQRRYAAIAKSRNIYTPQIVANGRDWREWPKLPSPTTSEAPVSITLTRCAGSSQVTVEVTATKSAPPDASYDGYWALLEDGHKVRVPKGENAGRVLSHDHVVRLYAPLSKWRSTEILRAQLSVPPAESGSPQRLAFVVSNADTMVPLQAAVMKL